MTHLRLTKISQTFHRTALANVERSVRDQLASSKLDLRPGASVAIGVGSRGIANLARLVKATADFLREKEAKPFIVPAMGSHGGATAEGQQQILAEYGVTEQSIRCPIRSSMETVEFSESGLTHKLFMDRHAAEADGVILINRIKPHTDFHGRYESGLVKMAVIGLGKERQAREMHRHGIYGLKELIPKAAAHVLASGKIMLGIAVVENAYDETALIEAVPSHEIMMREPALLAEAKKNMPRLPVDQLDVLIVDRMGKDVSGVGIDTNIIGRIKIKGEREPETPDIKMIVVADLTDASHGNATGIGLADVATQKLCEKIDFDATYKNVVTSAFLERGKLPVVAPTDEQAMEYALRACGPVSSGREKIIRIKDTKHLNELYVSPAVLEEINSQKEIRIIGDATALFDERGRLRDF